MALARIGIRTKEEENAGASLSGNERDHLFLNRHGEEFADISGVSGLDDPADGRAFGLIDYDRDGWQDLALVNSNAPWLELFRNRIGCHPATKTRGRFIAVRFVGGNRASTPNPKWSNRDGVGAKVTVDLGDLKLARENKAGEGFASENSATLLIGIGDRPGATSVSVRWPAGKTQTTKGSVPAGTLLTVFENPAQSPNGTSFVSAPYVRARGDLCVDPGTPATGGKSRLAMAAVAADLVPTPAAPRLRLFTTMATWCVACRGEIGRLNDLRAAFAPEELGMYGVPIDPADSAATIESWGAELKPPYRILTGAPPEQVAAMRDLLIDRLRFEAVPASIVTDADGNVLQMQWGPPSISRLRALLAAAPSGAR